MEFLPEIWTEEKPPPEAANCSRCQLQHQRTRVIWGEGAANASIVAILDNPGARETKNGDAFVCATRAMLQKAIHEAGIDKNDVYVTYLLKCRPLRTYDKPAARDACSGWLSEQIQTKKPNLIVLLGLVAAQHVLANPHGEMSELRGEWHQAYEEIPAAVTYHPLAVHRHPALYRAFLSDWMKVRDYFHLFK